MSVFEKGEKMPVLVSVLAFDFTSLCVCVFVCKVKVGLNVWELEPLT